VQFKFGGEADNILYLANDEQKATYLLPTIDGERKSCFATPSRVRAPMPARSAPLPSARGPSG
jgi:hypothetical protein